MVTNSDQEALLIYLTTFVDKLNKIEPSVERESIQLYLSLIISEIDRLGVERGTHPQRQIFELRSKLSNMGLQSTLGRKTEEVRILVQKS